MVQAIRVRGSPDISEPLEFEEQLGRAKVRFSVIPTGRSAAAANGNGNGKPRATAAAAPPAQADDGALPFDPPATDNEPPLFND
jgi:hypothetical protein